MAEERIRAEAFELGQNMARAEAEAEAEAKERAREEAKQQKQPAPPTLAPPDFH